MKLKIGLACAVAAANLLCGCAYNGYAGGYGPAGGPGPLALSECGAYYDDYYGPFDDGCWADDGGFWYRGRDHAYHRDTGGHFSHVVGPRMHAVRGVGPGAGAHFGGGGRRG